MNNYRIYRNSMFAGRNAEAFPANPLLSVGILDFGTHQQLLTALAWYEQNLNYGIHVITQAGNINIAEMQESHPLVTFIVFTTMAFSGEMINAFAAESRTNYFLITRTSGDLIRFDGTVLFSLMEKQEHPAMVCGVLANSRREIVPCVRAPLFSEKEERIAVDCSFPNMKDDTKVDTLYPVMELGLYDRALFQRLRGFDEQIHSEYWQSLDWGIRCWLYGYPIYQTQALLFQFPDQLSLIEDLTETEGYKRCITKALGIRQVGGKNVIRRPEHDVDYDVLRTEVKERLKWLVKQDYPHLAATWARVETGGKE